MYAERVAAIRAIDAGAKVGGPEVAEWNDAVTWVKGLIDYCGAHSMPLDFVSIHPYTGRLSETAIATKSIAAWAARREHRDTRPGGRGVGMARRLHAGRERAVQERRDVAELVRRRVHGFRADDVPEHRANHGDLLPQRPRGSTDTAFDSTGFFSRENVWANQGVLNMWQRLGDTVLTLSSHDLENGVTVLPTKNTSTGSVFVMIVNHKWRLDRSTPITITIPVGVGVTHCQSYWLIDGSHSDAYDEAIDDGTLQIGDAPDDDGELHVHRDDGTP